MRKATWAALLLAVAALTFGWPLKGSGPLHGLLSLAGLAGYILLSLFPPSSDRRFRAFLYSGLGAGFLAFLLVVSGATESSVALRMLARALAVANVALPLWLVAGPAQYVFVAAGAAALMTAMPGVESAGPWAESVHAYVACLGALWVAARFEGWLRPKEKKVKRIVVASNIMTLTPEEKAQRLAKVEARFRAGEIPEHKYWDLRQEIESR